MTEEELKAIEERVATWASCWSGIDVAIKENFTPVCQALREAWRQMRTLDIPIEMVEDTPLPDHAGTVGEAIRSIVQRENS